MNLSIITAVYNRPDVVGRCIESVDRAYRVALSAHDYNLSVEHIIVDDGSSDDTLSVVNNYDFDHLKVFSLPENRGSNAARNVAVGKAEGRYIIFLDSDDYFTDGALDVIVRQLISNPDYGHYLFANDDMLAAYDSNPLLNHSHTASLRYEDFISEKVGGDFTHVAKREIALKYPFNEKLRIYEHIVMMQYFREAGRILFSHEVTTIRERDRSDSATRESIRFNNNAIRQRIDSLKSQLQIFGDEYVRLNLHGLREQYLLSLAENSLLLSNYNDAAGALAQVKVKTRRKNMLRAIHAIRGGRLFRFLLTAYLKTKYKVR